MKEYLTNNWRRLDNTAKIFSLDDKENSNIFRYSIILKEVVDKKILKQAVEKTLDSCLAFKVKVGTGLFWNYFEFNPKEPIIEVDKHISCKRIDLKKNNEYLFKVTYYKKRINIDTFHVLTDGAGAIQFLKIVLCNYLDLKYNLATDENINNYNLNYQDQYLKNYDKNLKSDTKFKPAYELEGEINKNINNTNHYIIDIDEIKKVCKNYKATITEYLTAIYIYAIYLSIYNKKSNKEIVITVPIDLRKYYQVETLSNFFVCMNLDSKIVENKINTFDEILNQVKEEFSNKLSLDKIKGYLTRDVKLGMNVPIRLVPLPFKKLFIKFLGHLFNKSTTSTLSNVGIVALKTKYNKYVDNVYALVLPGKSQKIKCTICSFNNKLNVIVNSNIEDKNFQNTFLKLLKKDIINIKTESNSD